MINCLCVGSGRFLRSVLVPALIASDLKPVIIQTRGRTFMDYISTREEDFKTGNKTEDSKFWTYEVDTVEYNGKISTEKIPCYGAGSLGTEDCKASVIKDLLPQLKNLKIIGVGVTEAGLSSSSTKSMKDLYDVLREVKRLMCDEKVLTCDNPQGRICILNLDNVPQNGSLLKKFMMELASNSESKDIGMEEFLRTKIAFHDTMVDRITSQRPGSNGLVPRAEPTPVKALVVLDTEGDLPSEMVSENIKAKYGVVIRGERSLLDADIALKLRVANGTHTAVAHVMALSQLLMTDVLSSSIESKTAFTLMKYLDSFFERQIIISVKENKLDLEGCNEEDVRYVFDDWRKRLIHAHFGLSSFFITQNGAAKGGIRIGPTITDLVVSGQSITCSTVFVLAAILRFLTPSESTKNAKDGIYRGWFDKVERKSAHCQISEPDSNTIYADGLSYNLQEGWYEFRCPCTLEIPKMVSGDQPLPVFLSSFPTTMQPIYYEEVIRAYLIKSDGGNLSNIANNSSTKDVFNDFVRAIAMLYARMVAGDGLLDILEKLDLSSNCAALIDGSQSPHKDDYKPLHYREASVPKNSKLMKASLGKDRDAIRSVIFSVVQSAETIDLHTHLLPPSHGVLCLWGIDELLTYHYLVAEFFMTAPPSIKPEKFYAQSKQAQADMIWEALFLKRSPVSEACRGVITTLVALGLQNEVSARDLNAIRGFYQKFRDEGVQGAEKYSTFVHKLAGVRYSVMTNIPFDPTESQHWRPKRKEYSRNFRSALRIDPLLAGDRKTIEVALAAAGYSNTLEDSRQFLHDWCDLIDPEYMMASTPHDFILPEDKGMVGKGSKVGINEDAMNQPFAFVDALSATNCVTDCEGEDGMASIIDENSDFLTQVLIKVCEDRDLPIALKIGAHRKINPSLLQAGDGVVAFADGNILARLCTRFPKVRFLATFLSRNNQHEACVLATKFRNLHIYGCWWYCNNNSIIEEITKMRVEMLGTAFTAQHSDSRVLDQLIYKWSHSRAIIANVLTKEYTKLIESGWIFSRLEISRDIERLFGSSYEEFMSKSFA